MKSRGTLAFIQYGMARRSRFLKAANCWPISGLLRTSGRQRGRREMSAHADISIADRADALKIVLHLFILACLAVMTSKDRSAPGSGILALCASGIHLKNSTGRFSGRHSAKMSNATPHFAALSNLSRRVGFRVTGESQQLRVIHSSTARPSCCVERPLPRCLGSVLSAPMEKFA
jgi:hypothetical protein